MFQAKIRFYPHFKTSENYSSHRCEHRTALIISPMYANNYLFLFSGKYQMSHLVISLCNSIRKFQM